MKSSTHNNIMHQDTLPIGQVALRPQCRSWLGFRFVIIALALSFVSLGGTASAQCIDFEDFLHWAGSVSISLPTDVAVSGSYAYVTDQVNPFGFHVIDITDPKNPQLVGFKVMGAPVHDVAVWGNYAYVAADFMSGLNVIDISDPQDPQFVSSLLPGPVRGVAVSGTHAYITVEDGLQVIDISNPHDPQIVGEVYPPNYGFSGVEISGIYAYVADGERGLKVIDISNPVSPQLVGEGNTPNSAIDVSISGTHAYLAGVDSGLQVIDISDPHNPRFWAVSTLRGTRRPWLHPALSLSLQTVVQVSRS